MFSFYKQAVIVLYSRFLFYIWAGIQLDLKQQNNKNRTKESAGSSETSDVSQQSMFEHSSLFFIKLAAPPTVVTVQHIFHWNHFKLKKKTRQPITDDKSLSQV